jgi:hypothetical protein
MSSCDEADGRRPTQVGPKGFNRLERYVLIPLGFLWLVFLALLALPIMTIMTVLYYASRIVRRILPTGRRRRRHRGRAGEPAA